MLPWIGAEPSWCSQKFDSAMWYIAKDFFDNYTGTIFLLFVWNSKDMDWDAEKTPLVPDITKPFQRQFISVGN